MRNLLKLFSIIAVALVITACGGGGGGATPTGGSGTAAQYFTKKAVGNTWEWTGTATSVQGLPIWFPTILSKTATITGASGGIVTIFLEDPTYYGVASTYAMQINQGGEWTVTGPGGTSVLLPATFSVGTTWTLPAGTAAAGQVVFKVAGFNVTRTVPAGTFTDCLQLDWVQLAPVNPQPWDIKGSSGSFYFSPTAGSLVDATMNATVTVFGGTTWADLAVTADLKLQRYTAN